MRRWREALLARYGIDAQLARLDGEHDLNFAAEAADGSAHVLKVMRPGCPEALVDAQCEAIAHVRRRAPDVPLPNVVPNATGARFVAVPDEAGEPRLIWLQSRLPGIPYAEYRPHGLPTIEALGAHLGRMDAALASFDHPQLRAELKWHLPSSDWIGDRLDVFDDASRRDLVRAALADFEAARPRLDTLPVQAIHNDVNDRNVLVEHDRISGIVDFGDLTASPRICELAVAGAYVMLDRDDAESALAALVRGYHGANPLSTAELGLLWPLLRMRLALSVTVSTIEAAKRPDDPYVTVSQGPAWRLLERGDLDPGLVRVHVRAACDLPVTDGADDVLRFLDARRGAFAPLIGESLERAPLHPLSVAAATVPRNPFDMTPAEAASLGAGFDEPWLGAWGEPRLVYTAPAFREGPWKASDRRTVHLGVDVFAPAGTTLFAPLGATVEAVEVRPDPLDYGGVVVLRHETPAGAPFFALYGHLDPGSIEHLSRGDGVAAGDAFGALGDPSVNGGWAPHAHVQLALSTDGMGADWPGVANPDRLDLWARLCPNPAALLNLPDERVAHRPLDEGRVVGTRRAHFGANVKLSYRHPVMFLRGWRHHLFDELGRPYLDAYNNVPHVGHAHPRLQGIAADQLLRMNSNTRYLHPAQVEFVDALLAWMPDSLSVCYFVNSGSEANELALRLANAATGATDVVTPDHGYHGNTTGAIAISAYKFDAPGGVGQADHVQLVDLPDDYAGTYRREDPDRAARYAAQVDAALGRIDARGARVSCWISEVFPSVGGQIVPPDGYLASVYAKVRAAGGVCIADEVQTGLGRLGSHRFAFEHQGVVPDVVVLGKPIGNGHPIGVVIATREIADAFAKGPEYFSTFGGSTLSCRIGTEVLRIVEDEGLQANALARGNELLAGLRTLQARHEVVGDVRGMGLFVGVDLVTDRGTRAPATAVAGRVVERLRDRRVLVGTEGPGDNVLKIRPPLTIEADDVEMILEVLDGVLSETDCGVVGA